MSLLADSFSCSPDYGLQCVRASHQARTPFVPPRQLFLNCSEVLLVSSKRVVLPKVRVLSENRLQLIVQ